MNRETSLSTEIKRCVAITVLTVCYGLTVLISKLGRFIIRSRQPSRQILINGTFHNPNWFFAHIEPIVRSEYGPVHLVCDEVVAELPGLDYYCPPAWANRLLSRAGAKAILSLYHGIRCKAGIYVGYHIFPSAITALICARLTGGRAVYQVTSGPLELEGGGWHAENQLLVALSRPSAWVERLALAVTREFDLVVVRGQRAEKYIRDASYTRALEIVTGSVKLPEESVAIEKDLDIILVGRLTEYKRPDRFIEVMSEVARQIPGCRAALVGDGPDREMLERSVTEKGLEDNVIFMGQRSDVPAIMSRSRLFVLTSRWEGVSIAMLEAMSHGLVPVVSDVGDLRDFAVDDETGYVVPEEQLSQFASHIVSLLSDDQKYQRMSENARERAVNSVALNVVAKRWRSIFDALRKGDS